MCTYVGRIVILKTELTLCINSWSGRNRKCQFQYTTIDAVYLLNREKIEMITAAAANGRSMLIYF